MNSSGFMTRLMGWIQKPFSEDMSVIGWALFVLLILIAVFLWTRVLGHVVGEA